MISVGLIDKPILVNLVNCANVVSRSFVGIRQSCPELLLVYVAATKNGSVSRSSNRSKRINGCRWNGVECASSGTIVGTESSLDPALSVPND